MAVRLYGGRCRCVQVARRGALHGVLPGFLRCGGMGKVTRVPASDEADDTYRKHYYRMHSNCQESTAMKGSTLPVLYRAVQWERAGAQGRKGGVVVCGWCLGMLYARLCRTAERGRCRRCRGMAAFPGSLRHGARPTGALPRPLPLEQGGDSAPGRGRTHCAVHCSYRFVCSLLQVVGA